jgi:iron(III) transport system substrate-binding protein
MTIKFAKRSLAVLLACFCPLCPGQVPAGYPAGYAETISSANREGKLVIYSATDPPAAAPLLKEFRALYPGIEVQYLNMSSVEVYRRFMSESAEGMRSADALWSPAMDLQMKLVNDGHALTYKSPEAPNLPAWAVWRNEAFGTTYEPAVFVYNKRLVAQDEVPQTHAEFARLLRDNPGRFKGKVTTYDIEKVGVGFLLATQDSMTSGAFWDLARAMFAAGVQLQPTTGLMVERIASGESLIGYNLLGSYAMVRARTDPSIGYVLPRDYTLVMSRIVFISRRAASPNAARLWLDFLLSKRGQEIIARESRLFSLRSDVEGETTGARLASTLGGSIKPIVVGPGLLTYQDQAKRLEFIRKWRHAGSVK